MPDTLLYYITIQCFIFLGFFDFLYHTQTKYRGDILLWALGGGRRVGCMDERSMEVYMQLLNHVEWNAPCAEGAQAHQ
jgi:hypothetical protein